MSGSTRAARHRGGAAAVGLALAAAAEAATYHWWREWCLNWGATAQERARRLPGDELLASPDIVSTRVTWIGAPPEGIWPWLVQMGPGRGGAYTYDWIENLFGLGMHSADEILPQYQDLRVGDVQQLGKRGPRLRVAVLDPQRALVMRSDDGNWVWAFVLEPASDGTRLISRNRIATPSAARPARVVNRYLMEPGSLIMERRMLLGIRDRAERSNAAGVRSTPGGVAS
ncbi:MAG: hypothetical protein ACLQDY_06360 [Streptosporangiaceae bacterium]